MGGFESGKTEWLGDAGHDEDVGEFVNVAELFATDEAGEDDVSCDAEFGGEVDEFVFFFAVTCEDEDELGIFADSFGGGMEEVGQAFLDGKAADGADDGVAFSLERFEVFVVTFVEEVSLFEEIFVEGVVNDVDFVEGDGVFFVDDAFGSFGDGEDLVGEHETLGLDGMNERIATVAAGAVKFGGVDVGDERNAEVLFGEDASLEGEPIVGVNEVGFELHEVFFDEVTVGFLDLADGDLVFGDGTRNVDVGNDHFFDFVGVVGADAEAEERVEVGGGEDTHEGDVFVFGSIGDDKVNVAAILGEGAREVETSDAETSGVVRWQFPPEH